MTKKDRIIFIIFVISLLIYPAIVTNKYYVSVMIFVGIHSLITIGLGLLMGYAGQISLGHAAFFGLGAYTSGVLTVNFHFSPWLAFFLAILFTAFIAFFIGVPSLKLKGHYLAMATLGFGEIVHIFFNELVDLTGGPSGLVGIPRLSIGGCLLDNDFKYYYFVWTITILILFFSLNIINSRVGRALRSIHGSEPAANAIGVNTSKYKVQVFVLSAIYASIAGSLYAHFITFISPSSFSVMFSIILVTMVAIGGMTNVWGAILGAFILTTLPEYLRVFQDYDILIYGSILMLIMIFMPKGLFCAIAEWFSGFGRKAHN